MATALRFFASRPWGGRLLAAVCLALSFAAFSADLPYDLVFRNARVVDGTGSPWYFADLAVRGDTIVRIAPSITDPARRVIDLGGLVAAPGFIDIHTHVGGTIFRVPTADNYIRQGVTTVMEGADGGGPSIFGSPPVPLKPWLDQIVVSASLHLYVRDRKSVV